MLGCGVLGTGVARILAGHRDLLRDRLGTDLVLHRVAVRDAARPRDPAVPADRIGRSAADVVADPEVDVVVEVMGGFEPARTLLLEALKRGKPVVTANKELLASHGQELFAAADAAGVDLRFEAAVAGGIPLIAALKESLAGDRVRRVLGIVNGTTNYMLWRMTAAGRDYPEALAEATALGYAEPDPTADVQGLDAAAKCAILASIAFNTRVTGSQVYREGITEVRSAEVAAAARMGYVIKLLAIAEQLDEAVSARVHPALIPVGHPLASVTEAFNAVFLEADAAGELMLYGRGAGGAATGSAVVGDLATVARLRAQGAHGPGCTCRYDRPVLPMAELSSQFFVALGVLDQPGVLAKVASVFGANRVSIRSVVQRNDATGAELELVTHLAREADMQATLTELSRLDVVTRLGGLLRVAGEEAEVTA